MRPAKFFLPLANFLMRLGVAFYIFISYFHTVLDLQVKQFNFYFASVHVIFGFFLLVGIFAKRQTLTVLSSLILFLLALYQLFTYSGDLMSTNFASLLFFGMIVFYFLCNGNRN
jgi:hypothetical membrane protein